jgi:hypothetical protein
VTLLRGPKALRWQSVFLRHHQDFLEGAKDPDTVFRDFENHVLHVRQGYWGGACERARYWYEATVRALEGRRWDLAAYNAGVLSHYATDPLMPLHTAQSAAETNIHRAMEWSVAQTYEPIWDLTMEVTGLPQIEAGMNESWLEELVTAGAELANHYYEPLLRLYDFAAGAKHPPKGLCANSRKMIGQMLAFATVSLARILERACAEAGKTAEPPLALPSLDWFFASLDAPLELVLKRFEDSREAGIVREQYREFVRSGRVSDRLTEDVRVIRDLCGNKSVPAEPLPFAPAVPRPAAASLEVRSEPQPAQEPQRRTGLTLDSPVVDAPSIGPKTASRLAAVEIHTIGDLLSADPARVAGALDVPHISEAVLRDWQDQCRLMLDLPRLRGRDAQILVGAGYRTARAIAGLQPEHLLMEVEPFLNSNEGAWLLRDGRRPGLREATQWIGSAEESTAPRTGEPGLVS